MLGLFPCVTFVCFGYFRIAFAVCLAAHGQVHAYFCAFPGKVCVEVFYHFRIAAFCHSYLVFGNERQAFGRFYQFLELAGRNMALWAFFRRGVAFVYITAYGADEFLFHFCRCCFMMFI